MANIIAIIWDCDKTLIDGYMHRKSRSMRFVKL